MRVALAPSGELRQSLLAEGLDGGPKISWAEATTGGAHVKAVIHKAAIASGLRSLVPILDNNRIPDPSAA